MALFEVKPYDKKVYEEELKDFLPNKILDVHTHVYRKEDKDHKIPKFHFLFLIKDKIDN